MQFIVRHETLLSQVDSFHRWSGVAIFDRIYEIVSSNTEFSLVYKKMRISRNNVLRCINPSWRNTVDIYGIFIAMEIPLLQRKIRSRKKKQKVDFAFFHCGKWENVKIFLSSILGNYLQISSKKWLTHSEIFSSKAPLRIPKITSNKNFGIFFARKLIFEWEIKTGGWNKKVARKKWLVQSP